MRIGICDDLAADRAHLKALLVEKLPAITMLEYASGEELLQGLAGGDALDLLFLDICMEGKNGIEIAGEIRKKDSALPILFLTTAPEFAVASYRVHAQDYLLKPVERQLLFDALDQQIARLAQQQARILFQSTAGVVQIPVAEIVYLEVVARRLILVQQDGTSLESMNTIQSMEHILCKYPQFVRPHRSYLVNLNQVKRMDKEGFHTVTGAFVPVARNNIASMKSKYMSQILAK